jgi:hypothetical protein
VLLLRAAMRALDGGASLRPSSRPADGSLAPRTASRRICRGSQAQGVDHSSNWRALLYDRLWPIRTLSVRTSADLCSSCVRRSPSSASIQSMGCRGWRVLKGVTDSQESCATRRCTRRGRPPTLISALQLAHRMTHGTNHASSCLVGAAASRSQGITGTHYVFEVKVCWLFLSLRFNKGRL